MLLVADELAVADGLAVELTLVLTLGLRVAAAEPPPPQPATTNKASAGQRNVPLGHVTMEYPPVTGNFDQRIDQLGRIALVAQQFPQRIVAR